MPARTVRCQGAIVRDQHLLLIQHREHASGHAYWLLPGGGQEGAESEIDCVIREMREETGLEVAVERLILDVVDYPGGAYQRLRTYLCRVTGGQAAPGYEPELEAADFYGIAALAWFDLRAPAAWPPDVLADPISRPQIERLREALADGT